MFQVRRQLGLDASVDRTPMRDPTPSGGRRRARMSTMEAGNWLVYILRFMENSGSQLVSALGYLL